MSSEERLSLRRSKSCARSTRLCNDHECRRGSHTRGFPQIAQQRHPENQELSGVTEINLFFSTPHTCVGASSEERLSLRRSESCARSTCLCNDRECRRGSHTRGFPQIAQQRHPENQFVQPY
ncbi:hypothetical protein VNO80_21288 [Phaseolus coccineus]|uniref:Uncharacterized protein n=1 Tax=Phaseolus coccineus TaxID=3886 RepID=A0AAN9M275_PHACN